MSALDTATPARTTDLLSLDLPAMERFVQDRGWPRYRARQILRWLHRRRVREIDGMTDLSRAERETLKTTAVIGRAAPSRILTSVDGTQKFVMRLTEGLEIETVLIPDGKRLTLCISTQVGCTLDCGFCLTGTMGLQRNLKAQEIVDQVLMVQDHLPAGARLSNLVLMGMGEPLANLDAVAEAIRRLTDPAWGVGIAPRRITLSTAGLATRLADVAGLGINVAISLNATTNVQRDRLMPTVNRLHPLASLLAACRAYPLPARRKLTFEYVLIAGENDSEQDARRLAKLLNGMRCKINLIAFNPFPGSAYRRPTEESVSRFQSILKEAGFDVLLRKSRGRDVLGACGQLGRVPPVDTDGRRTACR